MPEDPNSDSPQSYSSWRRARRHFAVLMSVLLTAAILTMLGTAPASAQDEWADNCGVARDGVGVTPTPVDDDDASTATVVEPGQYSGEFSPEDVDAFIIPDVSEGEYVTISLNTTVGVRVHVDGGRYTTTTGGDIGTPVTPIDDKRSGIPEGIERISGEDLYTTAGSPEFRLYAVEGGNLCVELRAEEEPTGQWALSWSREGSEPQPATQGGNLTVAGEIEQLRQELIQLEERANALSDRIDQLQARLNQEESGGIATGNDAGTDNATGVTVGGNSTGDNTDNVTNSTTGNTTNELPAFGWLGGAP